MELNNVKSRFLPLSPSVQKGLEPEAEIKDFEIIKEICNNTYLVKHKATKAEYAIKALDKRAPYIEKPNFKELDTLYEVNHKNLVKLFGHFEDNNNCYFLMEYIPKGNVKNIMPKDTKKRLSTKVCSFIIRDVISAVHYLHNMKPPIIHGDIKPENVLLSDGLVAKQTDFGWDDIKNEDWKRKTIHSFSPYLTPEFLKDGKYDTSVDLWSIGGLLFELVTGNLLILGADLDSMEEQISKLETQALKNINADAKDLILKALKIEPKERLPLRDMMKHPFITTFTPEAENLLVKPLEGVKYEPFIISKDDPKTWVPKIIS